MIDLHEDWESPGFYLYEMFGDQGSLGREMVKRVARICPINENAEIEGEVAVNGVIHPNMEVARRKYGEGIPIALFQRGIRASGDVRNPNGAADGCARCGASSSY